METTTETPTTPTEGSTSTAAGEATLLTGSEPASTPTTTTDPVTPKEGETPAGEKTEEKPAGAPEKYEFKAPEGKEYDAAVLAPFEAAARKANLTQEAAQTLLEEMAPKLAERQLDQVKAVQAEWVTASKSDPEFGGDKFNENLAIAKKGFEAQTPAYQKLLTDTGLGNHPEVIRAMLREGKRLSEDTFVAGKAEPPQTRDIGKTLYDHPTSQGVK